MKKILLLLSIILISGLSFNGITYAAEPSANAIKVTVTEKIPGAGCIAAEDAGPVQPGSSGTYECTIEPGFGTVTAMMGAIIKYFTFLVALAGVLFIVYNGIMYSMGGIEQSLKDDAKKRIVQTLIGLLVLLLSGLILNLVAPWIYVA